MHRIDHPHHPISQTTAPLSVFTIFFISTTCPSYIQLPSSIIPFSPAYRQSPKLSTVTVHAYVPSNGNSEEEIKEPILPKKEEIPRMIPAEVGLAYCNKLFFLEKLRGWLGAFSAFICFMVTLYSLLVCFQSVSNSLYSALCCLNPVSYTHLGKKRYTPSGGKSCPDRHNSLPSPLRAIGSG